MLYPIELRVHVVLSLDSAGRTMTILRVPMFAAKADGVGLNPKYKTRNTRQIRKGQIQITETVRGTADMNPQLTAFVLNILIF